MNTIQDLKIDRDPNHVQYHPKCLSEIDLIKEDFYLIDIWRVQNPSKLHFTWRSTVAINIICYFLISNNLRKYVEHCNMNFGHRSDHSALSLVVENMVSKRGPGLWEARYISTF